ncbi:MAG: hydroxyacid dehydrogenase [Oscillospiraceae bacterium]|nr:hydroxyacid dehydrogenase [Oscillospiraceae bacterium]
MRYNDILKSELRKLNHKIIVLDDDPTGTQTVHDVPVYTDWSVQSLQEGFLEDSPLFFVLTNSRSFSIEKTISVHRDIAKNILEISEKLRRKFIIISRGDSTLRGHYPLETEILAETIEKYSELRFDGEIFIPFFKEGGRLTIDNIHYVASGDLLVPVAETEYARDKTFGYISSSLPEYIQEKSNGNYKASDVISISLDMLRKASFDEIVEILSSASEKKKIIVNASEYSDIEAFAIAFLKAVQKGKNYILRTAASFVKVISGIGSKENLAKKDFPRIGHKAGGLVVIGSYVQKTSEQLESLRRIPNIEFIVFNQHLALQKHALALEASRISLLCSEKIRSGITPVIYTRRDIFNTGENDTEKDLKLSTTISAALASIVRMLDASPAFIVAKGGITSSDIGILGLNVRKAIVAGQIKPGVPVWITGPESKFPGIPFVIFPGNVGAPETLKEVVEILLEAYEI